MSAIDKLARRLGNRKMAEKLVGAGLRNPAQIRKANKTQLRKIVGTKGLVVLKDEKLIG